jgi:tetratricopeptide (TPR) repeat protein
MPYLSLLLIFVALLSSCASVPGPTPDASLQSGSAHDGKARALYLYSRARISVHEGDYPAALNTLREAIDSDPDSAFLYTSMAEVKLKIGQIQEALEYIDKAIKIDPTYRAPYLLAGSVMAAAGKDSEAVVYLRKAVELDPAKEDASLQLTICLTHLFEYEEAVSTLKALIKVNSESFLGYYYLGKTYGQMKLYHDAAGYFSKTLEMRPDFDQAAIDLAATNEAMGDYAKAIEIYKRLVGEEDSKVAVLHRLIQLLIQQRRYNDALEYLRLAVDSGYGGQETLRKIGLIHMELDQFDEAIKIFNAMLEKDPTAYQVRLYLGIAFEEIKDLDAAFAEFRKIPQDSGSYIDAIGHIAFILKEKGKPELAVERSKQP